MSLRTRFPDPSRPFRRGLLHASAAGLVAAATGTLLLAADSAHAQPAQAWPVKPVTVIIPFAPGGTTDIQARIVSEGLSRRLGQPFLPRNMPGATGAIATEYVARAAPDGYTLLFASSAQTTSVPMTEKVNYKLEDLAPVSVFGRGALVLAIHAGVPAKTLREFIEYVKANQGKLNFASPGESSVGHLAGALFLARAGLNMVHIPYKGGGPAIADLIGGQVPMLFGNSGEVMSHAKNERIRVIGVSTPQRLKQLPGIPSVGEVLPGFEITAWQGMLAPAKTPRAVIETVSAAIQSLVREPAIAERLEQLGVEPIGSTAEQMAAIIKAEQPVYAEAVKAAGLGR
ncbi:MAG: tripartite tricarboxylate transporter substrate binding protein [Betaproteobacteria bacterium]|jgi:tripartite-type tricarboxylate transporter receptor subunit TctC|nr:tripartite tricarboxylate transporter substrate binding protein [Betaproteobacteria bacterium]